MPRRLLTVLLVLLTTGAVCAGAEAPPVERGDEIAKRLERRWRRIAKVRPRMGCRELFGFALEAAGSNSHLDKIERAFELAEQMQDRDPESRTFGNFKWYWEAEGPVDRNAVEFCMQQGVLVWMLYRDRLPPAGGRTGWGRRRRAHPHSGLRPNRPFPGGRPAASDAGAEREGAPSGCRPDRHTPTPLRSGGSTACLPSLRAAGRNAPRRAGKRRPPVRRRPSTGPACPAGPCARGRTARTAR